MKKLLLPLLALALPLATAALLTACATYDERLIPPPPNTDTELQGTWVVKVAELGGKQFPLLKGYELVIRGTRYDVGPPGKPNDHGKLVFFGDELAGQPRRMDAIGEDGPNQGKRYPSIYRLQGRDLEICYDLTQKDRPTDFASREGTMVLRVVYARK